MRVRLAIFLLLAILPILAPLPGLAQVLRCSMSQEELKQNVERDWTDYACNLAPMLAMSGQKLETVMQTKTVQLNMLYQGCGKEVIMLTKSLAAKQCPQYF